MSTSAQKELVKRHQLSQNKLKKQQEQQRERRKEFEDENKLYSDIIQSRLFKEIFLRKRLKMK